MFKFFVFNILLLVGLSGCVSTKNITYFQGDDFADTVRYSTLKIVTPPIIKIQTNDILAITVSSLSAESNEVFNFPNITPIPTMSFPGGNVSGSRNQPLGYTVNDLGIIELPLVGKVKVSELTLDQAANIIKTQLEHFLKEPTVSVRILNQKYTILGEVNRPGVYNLIDNQTTIIDALVAQEI
jgi:polysaccharide export outer membrane protein